MNSDLNKKWPKRKSTDKKKMFFTEEEMMKANSWNACHDAFMKVINSKLKKDKHKCVVCNKDAWTNQGKNGWRCEGHTLWGNSESGQSTKPEIKENLSMDSQEVKQFSGYMTSTPQIKEDAKDVKHEWKDGNCEACMPNGQEKCGCSEIKDGKSYKIDKSQCPVHYKQPSPSISKEHVEELAKHIQEFSYLKKEGWTAEGNCLYIAKKLIELGYRKIGG